MKKLLIFFVCIPFLSLSQWSLKESNDPFEGKTSYVYAKGYEGDFPYNNPILVFRKRNKITEIFISDAGSTACGDLLVSFSFGNPNDIIEFYASEGLNGDSGFLNTEDLASVIKLIKGLKTKNEVFVRWRTRCSENRFKISLNGSSKALSTIYDSNWDKNGNEYLVFKEKELLRQIELEIETRKKLKSSISNAINDCENCIDKYEGEEVLDLLVKDYFDKKVEKIEIVPNPLNQNFFVVYAFVQDGEKLKLPIYFRNNSGKVIGSKDDLHRKNSDNKYLDSLLSKYDNELLKGLIKKTILQNEKLYSFDVNNIEDVFYKAKTIFQKNRIMDGTLLIILRDKTFKRTDLWLWKEKIYLSELPDNFKTNTLY